MNDFTLSPGQVHVRNAARTFASTYLKDARASYEKLSTPEERFQSTKPILRKATELGLTKGHVPAPLGGTGGSFMDAVIMVEEPYANEPSVSLTLLATGLGLSTLLMGGSAEQHKESLAPFLAARARLWQAWCTPSQVGLQTSLSREGRACKGRPRETETNGS